MSLLTAAIFEPWYRLFYGPPLEELGHSRWEFEHPQGLVLVADGVGGPDLCAVGLQYALAAEGFSYAFENLRWGHGLGRWYKDLTDVGNRDRMARLATETVAMFAAQHPSAPIFLVGKSGGTGVIVRALEQLPPQTVESVVLLAPALSPTYDLSQALQAVRGDVFVFWSPLDVIVLGAGTQIFGTIDRVKSASAGLVRFQAPKESTGDARHAYKRLRHVGWRPSMAAAGHFGGHLGTDSPRFLRKYVAPLLRSPTTSKT